MKRKLLTYEQIAEAPRLRDCSVRFWTYAELGRRYGFSAVAVFYAINPPAKRRMAHRRTQAVVYGPGLNQIDEAALTRMLRAIPADTRDLTAKLLGDPLPGRSALDKKNSWPPSRYVNPLLATLRGMALKSAAA